MAILMSICPQWMVEVAVGDVLGRGGGQHHYLVGSGGAVTVTVTVVHW
jgi:hypothetical protein